MKLNVWGGVGVCKGAIKGHDLTFIKVRFDFGIVAKAL